MRTLVVAGEYPWPLNSGSRLRLHTILSGLTRCGPTELFAALPSARSDIDPPDPALGLDRWSVVPFDDRRPKGIEVVTDLAHPTVPLELPWREGPEVTRALVRFLRGRYDLVWYFGVRPWVLAGDLVSAPTVVDFIDLEDHKIAARLAVPDGGHRGPVGSVVHRGGRALSREEQRRWARLHRRAGRAAAASVVCSELDAERARASGVPRVSVIPNAYPEVEHPVGRAEVGEPPTVVFQGTLRYPPNAQAARFLVDEVGPMLRRAVPTARIRLVGLGTPSLAGLADPPAVVMTGLVPDITTELAGADLVVVPVRFGSGTRLKVLEAFAQRIPVASTTLGAEGLGAVDGTHLLVGDTPRALADACARLLTDTALRAEVTEAAHRLFMARFSSGWVEGQVAELAHRVGSVRSTPGRSGG